MPKDRKVVPFTPKFPDLFDSIREVEAPQAIERPHDVPGLHLGTSSFTAAGWRGSFYPQDLPPREYLSYYATKFNTVEVDSTFYAAPSPSTVDSWYEKAPPEFVFAAKVPQIVTHDRVLLDCGQEFDEFVRHMGRLREKLGPLVLQFPYFSEADIEEADFLVRLRAFLKRLAGVPNVRFAVEIRNKAWLTARLADLLREHRAALVLQDQGWMPQPTQLKFDYITTDFAYVRLLGDRKGIERQTKTWDKVIVDRSSEITSWVDLCKRIVRRGIPTYVYVNNHYSGHAPATVQMFQELWTSSI